MNRHTRLFCVAVLVGLTTSQVEAADLLWQQPPPVSNNLGGPDANYFNNTTATANVAPTAGDILFIGAGGNVSHSAGALSVQKLRVGHTTGVATYQGAGTVTVNNGATVNLTVTGTNANASLVVGLGQTGTLNIDGTGSSVTSAQLAQIGYGNNASQSATVDITNGGSLVVTTGNINVGDRNGSGAGIPGHLKIGGTGSTLTIATASANLNVGVWATSTYSQTGGTVSIGDAIIVGQRNADNTTFNVSGGSLTTGGTITLSNGTIAQGYSDDVSASFTGTADVDVDQNADGISIFVGTADARDTSLTIGGTASLTTDGTIYVGNVNASNSSLTVGDDAELNLGANITVGAPIPGTGSPASTASGSSLTVSGNAEINIPGTGSAGNIFIGRSTTSNSTFNMTGGTITLGNRFLMGTAVAPATPATNNVATHSGGKITTTDTFVVADSFGGSTYNLSGTGEIVTTNNGVVIVGRQSTAGVMNQTGGTVTSANGVHVGNAQNATTSLWGTGTYNVSDGTITANQTTGTALSIAPQGTGTFRVIGDEAIIDVNGNMTVNAGGSAQGTLAFQLETGENLSMIDVSGTATFVNGANLVLDDSLAAPTQTSYDVLKAASIVIGSINFTSPDGNAWEYKIVPSGAEQILRLLLPTGDYNGDDHVNAADYVTWRKPETNGDQGYANWRENFGTPPASASAGQVGLSPVPEPTAAMLLLIGMFAISCRRFANRA